MPVLLSSVISFSPDGYNNVYHLGSKLLLIFHSPSSLIWLPAHSGLILNSTCFIDSESKTTIILVVIVGALAIVAIVVSAVSLARNGSPAVTVNSAGGAGGAPSGQVSNRAAGGMRPQDSNPPPAPIYITPNGGAAGGGMAIDAGGAAYPVGTSGRIYSLAIGHDYGSHEYL